MKYKIINVKEILKDKTRCLSPKKFAGVCYRCEHFLKMLHDTIRENVNEKAENILKKTVKNISCSPKIGDKKDILEYIKAKKAQVKVNRLCKKVSEKLDIRR